MKQFKILDPRAAQYSGYNLDTIVNNELVKLEKRKEAGEIKNIKLNWVFANGAPTSAIIEYEVTAKGKEYKPSLMEKVS